MVARESAEGPFSEAVDGLPIAAIAHRRRQVQRDPHPTVGDVPGRSDQVTKGRPERRSGADFEAGGFESCFRRFLKTGQ